MERAIKRKVKQSDGTRSLTGAENLGAIYTVLGTAGMRGESPYQVCKAIFAKPLVT